MVPFRVRTSRNIVILMNTATICWSWSYVPIFKYGFLAKTFFRTGSRVLSIFAKNGFGGNEKIWSVKFKTPKFVNKTFEKFRNQQNCDTISPFLNDRRRVSILKARKLYITGKEIKNADFWCLVKGSALNGCWAVHFQSAETLKFWDKKVISESFT